MKPKKPTTQKPIKKSKLEKIKRLKKPAQLILIGMSWSIGSHYYATGWLQLEQRIAAKIAETKTQLVYQLGGELPAQEGPYLTATELALEHAKQAGIEPAIVRGLIQIESKGKTTAVSRAGAIGIMQVMPQTAKQQCGIKDQDLLTIPEINIPCGIKVLQNALKANNGNIVEALAEYNGGHKNKHIPETQRYARDVLRISAQYKG